MKFYKQNNLNVPKTIFENCIFIQKTYCMESNRKIQTVLHKEEAAGETLFEIKILNSL